MTSPATVEKAGATSARAARPTKTINDPARNHKLAADNTARAAPCTEQQDERVEAISGEIGEPDAGQPDQREEDEGSSDVQGDEQAFGKEITNVVLAGEEQKAKRPGGELQQFSGDLPAQHAGRGAEGAAVQDLRDQRRDATVAARIGVPISMIVRSWWLISWLVAARSFSTAERRGNNPRPSRRAPTTR